MINRRSYGLRLCRWLEQSSTSIPKKQAAEGPRGPPSSCPLDSGSHINAHAQRPGRAHARVQTGYMGNRLTGNMGNTG